MSCHQFLFSFDTHWCTYLNSLTTSSICNRWSLSLNWSALRSSGKLGICDSFWKAKVPDLWRTQKTSTFSVLPPRSTFAILRQGLRRKRLTLQLPEKKWAQDSSKKVDIHWLWSDTRRLLISSAILKALRSAKWIFFFLIWKRHTSFTNFFSGQIVGIVCSPSLLLRNFICTWDHDAHTWQDDENKAKAKELKKVCKLNRAACQLKLKLFSEAKASCDTVLKDDAHNVKALFRRAQAHFGLKSFMECTFDVKKVLELEPQNREARALAKEVQKAQKEEDQKSKGMFGKMCQALGTGPIREPYVDRRFDFDEEERLQKEASKEWLKSHWVELTILLSGSMGELSMLRD